MKSAWGLGIYIYIYIYIYIFIFISISISIFVFIFIFIFIFIFLFICLFICLFMCVYIYIHTHIGVQGFRFVAFRGSGLGFSGRGCEMSEVDHGGVLGSLGVTGAFRRVPCRVGWQPSACLVPTSATKPP